MKQLKICVDQIYYNIYIDDVLYPANTTYSTSLLGTEASGVLGLITDGEVIFQNAVFTSLETISIQILQCTTSEIVSSLLSQIFSTNSFVLYPFDEASCKTRAVREAVTNIGVTFFGNSTLSAKAILNILQANIDATNSVFKYAGLTVHSLQEVNITDLTSSNVEQLVVPPDVPDNDNVGSQQLTNGQIGGIVGGAIGFVVVILVAAILISEKRKKNSAASPTKRKHAGTMQIPKVPTIPVDGTLKKNKKKKGAERKRSTFLDAFGYRKTSSKANIMVNMAGDV